MQLKIATHTGHTDAAVAQQSTAADVNTRFLWLNTALLFCLTAQLGEDSNSNKRSQPDFKGEASAFERC